MKNPNGYGTVVKLSGARRNPYVARKTKGWNDKGHPIFEVIGYYPTRETGLQALAQFNAAPWDVQNEKITLAELYALWEEKKAHKLGASNLGSLRAAFKHCTPLARMRYKDIKSFHMQNVVDACKRGPSTQSSIKGLFYHLDRFALETDVITRQYSGLVTVVSKPESDRVPFTPEEVRTLWANTGTPWVDTALIFLYSGWRISELLSMRREDVNLDVGTMRGGVKTAAGRGRIVPIHSRIFPFVRARHAESRAYLIERDGQNVDVQAYRKYWADLMKGISAEHHVHETRHTFRSRLDSAGANKVCIDLLMGHKSKDIGERIYTHKTLEDLKNTVELVTD